MGASTFSGSIRSVAGVDFISSKDAATDLGIDRQSSTVLEVNNGTPVADGGAYRDLKVRTLTATGLSSQETIVATTSVTTPLVTNAGTLALSATGANPITFSSGGTEGFRLAPTTRNLLVGTTTDDGSSKLQVAGTVNIANTARLQFADAAHSINYLNAAGGVDGLVLNGYGGVRITTGFGGNIATFGGYSGGAYHANSIIGGTTDGNYRLDVQSSGSSGTLRVYDQTVPTGSTSLVVRAGAGQSTNALFNIVANDGTTSVFKALETKIGFFGATPVVKQTVTADAASIVAALQAYGLAV